MRRHDVYTKDARQNVNEKREIFGGKYILQNF